MIRSGYNGTMARIGTTQKKILLLLAAGVGIALSRSPRAPFRIIKYTAKEFTRIKQEQLQLSIRRLYETKLVDVKDHPDGSVTLVLNDEGRKRALTCKLDEMKIPQPKQWDRKWRIILFDIPEEQRKLRDALRKHFKVLGCYEFQKSVFVHPFECRNEIDFLIEFYHARRFVRFIVASEIDNELHLKSIFHL